MKYQIIVKATGKVWSTSKNIKLMKLWRKNIEYTQKLFFGDDWNFSDDFCVRVVK